MHNLCTSSHIQFVSFHLVFILCFLYQKQPQPLNHICYYGNLTVTESGKESDALGGETKSVFTKLNLKSALEVDP